jgi:O-antigen/teichoic acid export membrane protein
VLKQSAAYLGSSIVNKSVPFLLLPVLTRYMTPQEYGVVVMFQIAMTLYQAVLGLSVHFHVTRAKYAMSPKDFQAYLSAIYMVLFSSLVVGLVVTLGCYALLDDFLGFGRPWVFLFPVIACLSMSNQIYMTLLRAQHRVSRYVLWEFLTAVLNMSLSLLLVVGLQQGWEGRAIGATAPLVIAGLSVLPILWKEQLLTPRINAADVREIVLISLPLIPHAIAATVIGMSDRYMIDRMMGGTALGTYSVAAQFGMVMLLVSDAFAKAWQPFFFEKMSQNTDAARAKVARYSRLYLAAFAVVALAYSGVVYLLFPWLVGDAFQSARPLVFATVVACIPYAAYQLAFQYLVLLKRTRVLALTTVLAAAVAVLGGYILLSTVGLPGAPLALAIAYSVSFTLVRLAAQREMRLIPATHS